VEEVDLSVVILSGEEGAIENDELSCCVGLCCEKRQKARVQ
jgi:hypothetical protein